MQASSPAYATQINIGKTSQDRPNIDSKEFDQLNQRPINRQEIMLLNATDRTNFLAPIKHEIELPQDVIAALRQQPSYSVDHVVLTNAILKGPEPVYIAPVDVQFLVDVSRQTGGATAVAAQQDQQDCCNCCTLQ